MISWLTWPVDWLARKLSRRHVEEIQKALGDARYVEPEQWARLNDISPDEARDELERAVKAGVLEKMYLYEGGDAPTNFLVPEALLDKPIKLSEFGYSGEEQDNEVVASRLRSRPVYVSTGPQADHYVHAA